MSNVSEIGIIVRDNEEASWEWVRLPRLRIVRLTVSRLDQVDIARELKPAKFIVTWNPRLGHDKFFIIQLFEGYFRRLVSL